ncbi:hypothetical protein GCM10027610_054330 [Dactylosporangium cerinum]
MRLITFPLMPLTQRAGRTYCVHAPCLPTDDAARRVRVLGPAYDRTEQEYPACPVRGTRETENCE